MQNSIGIPTLTAIPFQLLMWHTLWPWVTFWAMPGPPLHLWSAVSAILIEVLILEYSHILTKLNRCSFLFMLKTRTVVFTIWWLFVGFSKVLRKAKAEKNSLVNKSAIQGIEAWLPSLPSALAWSCPTYLMLLNSCRFFSQLFYTHCRESQHQVSDVGLAESCFWRH